MHRAHMGARKVLCCDFSSDGKLLASSGHDKKVDVDRFTEDGSPDDDLESFISHDDTDPGDALGLSTDVSKGESCEFTFTEVRSVCASASKVICCDFSSDGKLLASGGHDKKIVLWNTDSLEPKTTFEEHSSLITDVRFSPSMPRLATSSFESVFGILIMLAHLCSIDSEKHLYFHKFLNLATKLYSEVLIPIVVNS